MKTETDPNTIVYFENQYVPLADAKVNILTHALHYGTGVFEGIRAYWDDRQKEMFLVRPVEHYARWKRNCGILRIDVPQSPAALSDITVQLVLRNNFQTNLYVRPLAYKSAQRVGVMPDDQDSFAIMAIPFGEYLHSHQGLHAGIVSWRRIEDNAIPGRAKICGAYVNSALATDEARRNGKLITPPGIENILEGITRDSIMELARRELNLDVIERPISRSELYICDELFFTGTAVEIAPVVRVDHRPVGTAAIGAITSELRRLYTDATRGRLPAYRKWLVPVFKTTSANLAA